MAQSNSNGQANSFADVSLALTDLLDEVYQQESKTAMWTPNPALVRGFQKSKTGQIATIATSGLGNYDPNKGYPLGNASLTFEDYTLRNDRGVQYLVDQVDVMQSANLPTASAVLAEFSRSQLVPELDAARISAVVARAQTDAANRVKADYTPDKATMLSTIMDALEVIGNDTGVDSGIDILVNRKYAALLKGSTEVTRTKNIESNAAVINNKVTDINDNLVHYVPSARMYSAFNFKAGTTGPTDSGFEKKEDAVEVVALLTAPGTAQGIVAHQVTKIIPPDLVQGADGSLINFRVYHDCLVPTNKIPGIYAILAPAEARGTEAVQTASVMTSGTEGSTASTSTRTTKSKTTS